MRIGRRFFQRDPVVCARELAGCRLQWGKLSGVVVETEAYDGADDEACHTWFRPSARAFVAEHPPGAAYVYLNYGMHWMLNVLVKGKRQGFVLIRALEPLQGLDAMREARGVQEITQFCSGPGKLTDAAFGFHRHRNIEASASPRIGISRAVDFPWRFFVPGNPHVSGKKQKTGQG